MEDRKDAEAAAAFAFVLAYQRARQAFNMAADEVEKREGVEALRTAYHEMLRAYVHMRPGDEPSVVSVGPAADPEKTELIEVTSERGRIVVVVWEDVSLPLIPRERLRYVLRKAGDQLKIERLLFEDIDGRWVRTQP